MKEKQLDLFKNNKQPPERAGTDLKRVIIDELDETQLAAGEKMIDKAEERLAKIEGLHKLEMLKHKLEKKAAEEQQKRIKKAIDKSLAA